jgi:pimeloyl-ACP methyl ester carboxylesterase
MRFLLTALFWIYYSVSSASASETLDGPSFVPCSLTDANNTNILYAECSIWNQPLDHQKPSGKTIELFVTKIPSTAVAPSKHALTLINGGPGGSSVDLLVSFAPILQQVSQHMDIIVLDQRGTGRSTALDCENMSADIDPDTIDLALETKKCLDSLAFSPVSFTTSVAVRDLENLRIAMGYEQWNIYGTSYGTRVALHYLRRYEASVRSLTLDGVLPPSISMGSNIAAMSDSALRTLFQNCSLDTDCKNAYPNLSDDFGALSVYLKENNIELRLRQPITNELTTRSVSYPDLALIIRLSLYSPEMSALLPLTIHSAINENDYTSIAVSAQAFEEALQDAMSYGMHNAVMCTEDVPFHHPEDTSSGQEKETYLGDELWSSMQSICSVWPAGKIDNDFKRPVLSNIPTLILSGENDPITPPAYGDLLLDGLSNAVHLVGPQQGHGVMHRGCFTKIFSDFLTTANVSSLESSCIGHLPRLPFFVDSLGPAP